MTSEELDQIEARANAATPGPWKTHVVYRVITPRAGDVPWGEAGRVEEG